MLTVLRPLFGSERVLAAAAEGALPAISADTRGAVAVIGAVNGRAALVLVALGLRIWRELEAAAELRDRE
jgi:hypothetical protein